MNKDITIEFNDGERTVFPMSTKKTNLPSVYVFAMHKSGSVLLNSMVRDLCGLVGYEYADLPVFLVKQGLSLEKVSKSTDFFNETATCYSGFRAFPDNLDLVGLSTRRSVLLVRDPRDMVVSFFYSMKKSHPIPEKGNDREVLLNARKQVQDFNINDYVCEIAPMFQKNLEVYYDTLLNGKNNNVKLFRYEDYIFEKERWLTETCDWFGWDVSQADRSKIVARYDIRKTEEDQNSHVRRVTPGDHKSKLTKETIETLNQIFKSSLDRFNYNS